MRSPRGDPTLVVGGERDEPLARQRITACGTSLPGGFPLASDGLGQSSPRCTDAGRLVDERITDASISTAHKAKGASEETFCPPNAGRGAHARNASRDEAMLSYVAVTRAKSALDTAPGLDRLRS
jgi:hypothetical protein